MCFLNIHQPCSFHFIYLSILFLTVLGLHCCTGFSLVAASTGESLAVTHGLPSAAASLLQSAGSGLRGVQ